MTKFMDLPSEIRVQIYSELLVLPGGVRLEIRINTELPEGREVVRTNDYRRITRLPRTPKNTAILHTCRQVHAEAEPVLYGDNIFRFTSAIALWGFLELIGRRTEHLRYIRMEPNGAMDVALRNALRLLTPAKRLRRLEFHHADVCPDPRKYGHSKKTPEGLASDCEELIKSLYQADEEDKSIGDSTSVLGFWKEKKCYVCTLGRPGFDPESFDHLWRGIGIQTVSTGCICSKIDAHNSELESKLRTTTAAFLQPQAMKRQLSSATPGKTGTDSNVHIQ